jgi:plasmid maintenance system killer protein
VKRPDMKNGRWRWRVTFPFEDGDAYDVDLTDYH